MAEVFLCEVVDDATVQHVALKVMKQGMDVKAFAREADLMAVLRHPNLVRRLESGSHVGRPFIAMEHLAGGDLRQLLRAHEELAEPVPLGLALHVTTELLKGLAYFHGATTYSGRPLRLVHADVDPSNVLFSDEGEIKLGDFGVARSRTFEVLSPEGLRAGKRRYVAPEVLEGATPAPSADLYSAGVLLRELVFTAAPDRTVDEALSALIRRAVAQEPSRRFGSAGEFAGALVRYQLDAQLWTGRNDVREHLGRVLGIVF